MGQRPVASSSTCCALQCVCVARRAASCFFARDVCVTFCAVYPATFSTETSPLVFRSTFRAAAPNETTAASQLHVDVYALRPLGRGWRAHRISLIIRQQAPLTWLVSLFPFSFCHYRSNLAIDHVVCSLVKRS